MHNIYVQKSANLVQTKRENVIAIPDDSLQNESLQRKADMANNAAQRVEAPRPNNTGMPDNLKSGIESLSGFSMDDVRVHYNSSKPATVQALAYTQGTDIHVAPGQEKHLPHEAWHVAQQMAGRVSPTTNINGMPVNDNAGLEHEADVMGEKAVQCKEQENSNFVYSQLQNSAVQRMAYYTGSASETEQYEGDDATAEIFGWNVKEKKTKDRKRPENVARKVDQYKKEILTYIASCIHEQGEKSNRDYGPHISVVITRGIWFIAINTDYVKEGRVNQLRNDANIVKNQIMEKWNILSKDTNFIRELKTDDPENVDDGHAKKQALYIVYRWAGKDNGIVVEQNQIREKDKGVIHGEMATIKFLQKKSNMLNQAKILFEKAKTVIGQNGNDFGCDAAAKATNEAVSLVADTEVAVQNITDAVEATQKAIVADRAVGRAADKAAAVEKAFPTPNESFEKAQKYVKTARDILDDCLIVGDSLDHQRVIRVGGTKTACFDCGYEMNLHNKSERALSTDGKHVHNADEHRAYEIGPRKIVTMTSNCGDGFDNWFYGDDNGGKSLGMCKPDLLQNDFHQNQDYSELYNTFNSIDSIGEKKMQITYPMIDIWKQRMNTFEEIKSKNTYDLSCFASLNLENSLQLKSLIEGNLEKIYKLNDTLCVIPTLSSEQKSLDTCLITINGKIDLVNENLINNPFSLNFEEKKSFIYDFIQYERLVVSQLNMNIQKQIATNEYNSLHTTDQFTIGEYTEILNCFTEIKKMLSCIHVIKNEISNRQKNILWNRNETSRNEIDKTLKKDKFKRYFSEDDVNLIENIIHLSGKSIDDNTKQDMEKIVDNFYKNLLIRKAKLGLFLSAT